MRITYATFGAMILAFGFIAGTFYGQEKGKQEERSHWPAAICINRADGNVVPFGCDSKPCDDVVPDSILGGGQFIDFSNLKCKGGR